VIEEPVLSSHSAELAPAPCLPSQAPRHAKSSKPCLFSGFSQDGHVRILACFHRARRHLDAAFRMVRLAEHQQPIGLRDVSDDSVPHHAQSNRTSSPDLFRTTPPAMFDSFRDASPWGSGPWVRLQRARGRNRPVDGDPGDRTQTGNAGSTRTKPFREQNHGGEQESIWCTRAKGTKAHESRRTQ
jgi:hypothetical protein